MLLKQTSYILHLKPPLKDWIWCSILFKKRTSYKAKQYHCVFTVNEYCRSPTNVWSFIHKNRQELPDHPFFEISTFQAEKPPSADRTPIVQLFANFMPFFLLRSWTGLQLPESPIIKAAFPLKKPHTLQINNSHAQNIFKGITSPVIVSTRYHFTNSKHIH